MVSLSAPSKAISRAHDRDNLTIRHERTTAFVKALQAACTSTHTTIKTVLFDGYACQDMRTWRIAVYDVYQSSKEGTRSLCIG